MVVKVPPVVAAPTPEAAVFGFGFLSFTGTGILFSALLGGLLMGFSPVALVREYFQHDLRGALFAAHHRGDAGAWAT